MADTPKLILPEISVSQTAKETTHSDGLWILDALVQASVKDKNLATPPGSPTSGDCYIVASSATGDWTGWENRIAQYVVDTWESHTPNDGWKVWVEDEEEYYYYDSSTTSWVLLLTDVVKTSVANEYTKTQNFNATTLTDAANISWDAESNQVCSVTLAGNRTLDNPTNMVDGGIYHLTVIQDGTGSRTLSYGTAYKWPGGTAPTLSTGASAVDIFKFVSDGTSMYGSTVGLNFS